MDVSVIVPTRNRSAMLALTLRSVRRQEGVTFEIVVVDEGSTDETAAMLSDMTPHVRVVRHDAPRGLAAARNHGAEVARGEWLAFLDDDDLWAPDKLKQQLDAAERSGRDWVYAGTVNFEDCRIVYSAPPVDPDRACVELPHVNVIPGGGSNVAVRRDAWEAAGPFNVSLRAGEDWEMWIRLASRHPAAWVCEPLIAKRIHPSNMSLDTDGFIAGTRQIEALHHTQADWGRIYRWLAERHLRSGRRVRALTFLARAAAAGDLRGGWSDLRGIAARRIHATGQSENSPTRSRHEPWRSTAVAWLREYVACIQ
jgi:glycosyltransferase involved in cell wall biosynthesis